MERRLFVMAKKLENIYKKEKKDITFEKCGLDIEKNFILIPRKTQLRS